MGDTQTLAERAREQYQRQEALREAERAEAAERKAQERREYTQTVYEEIVGPRLREAFPGVDWTVIHHEPEPRIMGRECMYVQPIGDDSVTLAFIRAGDGGHIDLARQNESGMWLPARWGHVRSLEDLGRALISFGFGDAEAVAVEA